MASPSKVRICNAQKIIQPVNSNVNKTNAQEGSTITLKNPNIALMKQDFLYHLCLDSGTQNLVEMFGDVKFVCLGGTATRMESFAHHVMQEIDYKLPAGSGLIDISRDGHRYSMYKVGPVLSVNHGMGGPSIGILLHELIKLMWHAKTTDPVFFRMGTCGGIGVEGGTVVISEDVIDATFNHNFRLPILGKIVERPTRLDQNIVNELKALAEGEAYNVASGITMCADDFYEGQGRLDGAFCDYTEADKLEYLRKLQEYGVRNIEMESLVFSAILNHAGIKAAIICTALLNRLNGDQITATPEDMEEWQQRVQRLVIKYIKNNLK